MAVEGRSSVVRAPADKAGGLEFDCWWLHALSFFFSSSWLTNVDEKRICGALAQLSCYQHRYEWGEGSMVLYYRLAATNIDMNGRVCVALAQFGCYQHRHK